MSLEQTLTMFLSILSLTVTTALAQLSPPASGIQLANTDAPDGFDIRFPLTVTQCEPVPIYYNMSYGFDMYFLTPDLEFFFKIPTPSGAGYIEWTCNIPAGYGVVVGNYRQYYFVVQPSAESSCLRDLTTTYVFASYETSAFTSYTAHPPNTTPPLLLSSSLARTVVAFPTGSFSTITANADLHASPTTRHTSTSSPSSSPSSRRSQTVALVGSIFGGLFLGLAIALCGFLVYFRRFRPPASGAGTNDSPAAPAIKTADVRAILDAISQLRPAQRRSIMSVLSQGNSA